MSMPRRRTGLATSVAAAVKHDPAVCGACRETIKPGDRVSWTSPGQRIHESCVPISRLANRGGSRFGPWVAECVGAFLSRHDDRFCASCLALGLSLMLEEARAVMGITASRPGFEILPVACTKCQRQTDVLCIVPVSSRAASSIGYRPARA
jgi:hypothetical protein